MSKKSKVTTDAELPLPKSTEPKPDKVQVRKETKQLACKLTEAEVTQYGRDLAGCHSDYARVEAEFAAIKSDYKGKLEGIDAKIGMFSGRISSGLESRDVACEETRNWTLALVRTIRTDTGEQLEQRPMREDEKQMEIPNIVPEAATDTAPESKVGA